MTRPDLETMVESEASRTDFECGNYRQRDLLAFAHRVAAHERTRILGHVLNAAVAYPMQTEARNALLSFARELEAET